MMDLLWLGIAVALAVGIVVAAIILLTRALFNRDFTLALKRVNQQERALQEQADILESRLAQMERDYQAKLARAATEAERVVADAKSQAMNIRTVAIEEAKHRARQLMLEAEQQKAQLRTDMAGALNGMGVSQACDALRALLPAHELIPLHRRLTRELLEALQHVDTAGIRAGVTAVEVTSAEPLTAEESERLTQWTATAFGSAVAVRMTTDPALLAGAVIRLGATMLDNSLPNRLGRRMR